jgi:hypothetical protein
MEQREGREGYPAEKVRQGEIILRSRTRRLVFIICLLGAMVLLLLLSFLGSSRNASGEALVLKDAIHSGSADCHFIGSVRT